MERQEPERDIEELEERGEKVERDIEETKHDWEAKQESSQVAGAVKPEDDSQEDDSVEPEDDSQE